MTPSIQREIKFRAWDIKLKEFVPTIFNMLLRIGEPLQNDIFEFNQYTGLKDKNGKDIYEGDIVEWDDGSNGKWRRRCKVVYVPAHYRLEGYYYDISQPEIHNPINFDCGAFIYESDGELEVVGNIYENPDLLSSKE